MPTGVHYTILDYGLTAVALVLMGLIVYLFVKFLTNHCSKMTQILTDLVEVTRDLKESQHGLRDISEDVRDEVRYCRGEILRNREEMRKTCEK